MISIISISFGTVLILLTLTALVDGKIGETLLKIFGLEGSTHFFGAWIVILLYTIVLSTAFCAIYYGL
jgi:hypothetical protein